eukprot:scaffold34_cov260-Pinguiococcus_pyrenoidosus.AAC.12
MPDALLALSQPIQAEDVIGAVLLPRVGRPTAVRTLEHGPHRRLDSVRIFAQARILSQALPKLRRSRLARVSLALAIGLACGRHRLGRESDRRGASEPCLRPCLAPQVSPRPSLRSVQTPSHPRISREGWKRNLRVARKAALCQVARGLSPLKRRERARKAREMRRDKATETRSKDDP